MMLKLRKTFSLVLLTVCSWVLFFVPPLQAQDPGETVPRSLFQNDTCAPPCWFGLTPGESTSADVEKVFRTHPDLTPPDFPLTPIGHFDPQTGDLLDGVYLFGRLVRDSLTVEPNRLYIRRGKVFWLSLSHGQLRDITLGQAFDYLGLPDRVHVTRSDYNYDTFDMIYLKWRLRLSFWSVDNPNGCQVGTIREAMRLNNIRYYSPEAATEVNNYVSYYGSRQPSLTAFERGEQNLSLAEWEAWLAGDPQSDCFAPIPWLPPVTTHHYPPLVVTEPQAPRSVFADDTCAPPCWFGLTPGISTAADVTALLQSPNTLWDWTPSAHENVMDPQTGSMLNGAYWLLWADYPVIDYSFFTGLGFIRFKDGKVSAIDMPVDGVVFLEDVLRALGTPDQIWVGGEELIPDAMRLMPSLSLLYPHLHMDITLFSDGADCDYAPLGQHFWVDRVRYGDPYTYGGAYRQVIPAEWATWLQANCYIYPDG